MEKETRSLRLNVLSLNQPTIGIQIRMWWGKITFSSHQMFIGGRELGVVVVYTARARIG